MQENSASYKCIKSFVCRIQLLFFFEGVQFPTLFLSNNIISQPFHKSKLCERSVGTCKSQLKSQEYSLTCTFIELIFDVFLRTTAGVSVHLLQVLLRSKEMSGFLFTAKLTSPQKVSSDSVFVCVKCLNNCITLHTIIFFGQVFYEFVDRTLSQEQLPVYGRVQTKRTGFLFIFHLISSSFRILIVLLRDNQKMF